MFSGVAYTEGKAVICHSEATPKNLVVDTARGCLFYPLKTVQHYKKTLIVGDFITCVQVVVLEFLKAVLRRDSSLAPERSLLRMTFNGIDLR